MRRNLGSLFQGAWLGVGLVAFLIVLVVGGFKKPYPVHHL